MLKDNQQAPLFFANQSLFRKWLQKNHKKETELIVGFYKVASGKPSMTWSESVDQALCFGWIDGITKSIDKDSYKIRFTQRKPNSIWSAVNIKKVEALKKKGLMQPAGLEIYSKRTESKSKIYAHETEALALTKEYTQQFKENSKAWKYFQSLSTSYKKLSIYWVMSAKQTITQLKRLQQLITESESETNQFKDSKFKTKKSKPTTS